MNKRLLLTTTAALAIATSAFAQSAPSSSSSTPSATPHQNSTSSTSSAPNSPPTASTTTSSGTAQTASPPANSAQTQSPSVGQSNASGSSSTGTNTNTTQAPSQAQTAPSQTGQPANQAQTNQPSTAQTPSANPSAASSNQAQPPSGSANTAQQPSSQQTTADRASNTNVNASVNINEQQRTRISQSISHLNVQPLNSVNFSLSVGTAVPRDVRLQPLPAEVVEVVPQYRGYDFVLVKDEIVVVEPSSYKIVAVLPYSGHSTAAAPVRSERKTTFSESDREVIRKHTRARSVERGRPTTGSTVRTEIRTGERLPEGVEIEAFPDEVYREAPTLREYRYINRDSHTYIVEPHERRVIEEID